MCVCVCVCVCVRMHACVYMYIVYLLKIVTTLGKLFHNQKHGKEP